MDYEKKYRDLVEAVKELQETNPSDDGIQKWVRDNVPELNESEAEKIRKALVKHCREQLDIYKTLQTAKEYGEIQSWIAWLEKQKDHEDELEKAYKTADEVQYRRGYEDAKREFEKQCEQKPQGKSTLEVWKDMRLEVYAQASGNRHEPNCSDDKTKMFSLSDIDEIIEKISEQKPSCYSCESDIDFKIEADKWYVCIKDYYYSDIDELMFTKGKTYKAYTGWGFISNNGTKKTPIGMLPYKEYFRPATDEEIPHEQKPNCKPKVDLSKCSEEYRKAYYDGWNNCNQQHSQLRAELCSEEDKVWINRACMLLYELNDLSNLTLAKIPSNVNDIISHLKSIKDRVQPQPKQEWSEEDKVKINRIVAFLENLNLEYLNVAGNDILLKDIEWLKSLKDRVKSQAKQ